MLRSKYNADIGRRQYSFWLIGVAWKELRDAREPAVTAPAERRFRPDLADRTRPRHGPGRARSRRADPCQYRALRSRARVAGRAGAADRRLRGAIVGPDNGGGSGDHAASVRLRRRGLERRAA